MTDTSALIEGHHLVTSYPAAWCQCHHRLAWDTRAEDHAAHVIVAIQAQALLGARAALQAAYKRGPGANLDGHASTWRKGMARAHRIVIDYQRTLTAPAEENDDVSDPKPNLSKGGDS